MQGICEQPAGYCGLLSRKVEWPAHFYRIAARATGDFFLARGFGFLISYYKFILSFQNFSGIDPSKKGVEANHRRDWNANRPIHQGAYL
jgi:hypothetical protein